MTIPKITGTTGLISKIKTKLKKINPLGVTTTAAGLTGAGIALYDANAHAKIKAYEYKNIKDADAGFKYFNNTQYLDNESKTTTKIKEKMFNWELTNTLRGALNASSGYASGFASGILGHTLTIASSAAAICLKGKKALIGVAGLALGGIYSIVRHACSNLDNRL